MFVLGVKTLVSAKDPVYSSLSQSSVESKLFQASMYTVYHIDVICLI